MLLWDGSQLLLLLVIMQWELWSTPKCELVIHCAGLLAVAPSSDSKRGKIRGILKAEILQLVFS